MMESWNEFIIRIERRERWKRWIIEAFKALGVLLFLGVLVAWGIFREIRIWSE